jgi:hypothetical protein
MTGKALLWAVAFLFLVAPSAISQSNAPLRRFLTRLCVLSLTATRSLVKVKRYLTGVLVARRVETFQAGVPNIRLYDRNGSRVREAAVWFPEAQRVLVYSAAVTQKGEIVAGGSAKKTDGTSALFISLSDASGKLVSVVQTIGFAPVNICLAPDGTVWSFGGTGYDEASQPKPGDTLRHFDFRKGQISSYLPRSTFPSSHGDGPEVRAQIQCSADGLTVYSLSASAYIEMKYAEASPHLYHVAAPSNVRYIDFATTGPEQTYAFFSRSDFGGLYYLAFDESGKPMSWLPVKGAVGPVHVRGVVTGLWGAEGNKLLVSRGEDTLGV